MYQRHPSWVIGFYGTTENVVQKMVNDPKNGLWASNNDYDWLGKGVYFWENDEIRALDFAKKFKAKDGKKVAVVGAVIDLGLCMNMFEQRALLELAAAYREVEADFKAMGKALPTNSGKTEDKLFRRLDQLVFERVHELRADTEAEEPTPEYDTVRGGFSEGENLYEGTLICEFNHIQIAVRNPKCIKGYFLPRA